MHIRMITPVITTDIRSLAELDDLRAPDIEFSHAVLDHGPSSIECEYDHALAVPDTVRRAEEAERDGVDAIVIDCMADPGLHAARERVSIPVIGPGETSMHLAAMLAHKFSIVTILESVRPMLENLAKVYGVADKLASIGVVDVPVLELKDRLEEVHEKLALRAIRAVEDDHAGLIVLGCTGFLGCADAIVRALEARGHQVPVIDPIPATISIAQALVKARLTHSKHSYATPRHKPVVGYGSGLSLAEAAA